MSDVTELTARLEAAQRWADENAEFLPRPMHWELTQRLTGDDPRKEWWILTGGFMSSPMSRLFSGPYSTKADAHTARTDIERIGRRNDLFIDSRPVPEKASA